MNSNQLRCTCSENDKYWLDTLSAAVNKPPSECVAAYEHGEDCPVLRGALYIRSVFLRSEIIAFRNFQQIEPQARDLLL